MAQPSTAQLHRYAIASELARGKLVLEIASDVPSGSSLLARGARQVVSLNLTSQGIENTDTKGQRDNLFFAVGMGAEIPVKTGGVDLIVMFETAGHHGQRQAMMAEVARVLRSGGAFVIWSPDKYERSGASINQNGVDIHTLFLSELEPLLRSQFRNVALFEQRITIGSYLAPLSQKSLTVKDICARFTLDSLAIEGQDHSSPCCVMAIASNGPLPNLSAVFSRDEALVSSLQAQLEEKEKAVAEKERTISELNMQLLAVQHTIGWRALIWLQKMRDQLLPIGSARRDFYWSLRRVTEVLLDGGPNAVLRRIRHRIHLGLNIHDILPRAPGGHDRPNINSQYQVWLEHHQLKPADIKRMRAELETFAYIPLISIAIPVYNTEELRLRRAIESVLAQVYQNWEICLVNDASTKNHIVPLLDGYAASNDRIRVKHLSKRTGITGASSAALAMTTGEFVGLLDHDDELTPDALWEVVSLLNRSPDLDLVYSDEDKLTIDGIRVEPFFKPDWSPDLLLSMNYITHFAVFRRSLLEAIGGFRPGYEGAQDYDLLLRATEKTNRIAHVPKILYHWRMGHTSAASLASAKPLALESGRRAIEDALKRRGDEASVEVLSAGRYRAKYKIHNSPLVSIIIPTKDQVRLLQQCVTSIEAKTRYPAYEIIIIDNNSSDPETIHYLDALSDKYRVLRYPDPFDFSAINNFGARQAKGEHLLFLNDDTQVSNAEWLTALVEQAQRPGVGAVGAKLLYPDNRIQHAGVIVGIFGGAGHAFRSLPNNHTTYFDLADLTRNCSAVTAACMIVPRKVFNEVGGFDENLRVVYNDVDLCLRIREHGYLILYTPFAVLYHFESATRGSLRPTREEDLFCRRWADTIRGGDPYYNPSLTLTREDWSLRI